MSYRLWIIILCVTVLPVSAHKTDTVECSTKYVKTSVLIKDLHFFKKDAKLLKKNRWLQYLLDEAGVMDTFMVPLSTDERVIRITRNKRTGKAKQEVLAVNREGMNEIFNTEDIIDLYVKKKLKDSTVSDTILKLRKRKVIGQIVIRRRTLSCDSTVGSVSRRKFRTRPKLQYSGMVDYRKPDFWARYDSILYGRLKHERTEDSLNAHTSLYDSLGIVRHYQSAVQENICMGLDYATKEWGWGMNFITFPLKSFINNYIEIGRRPVFSIEPVSSIFSVNTEDGFRLRMGGRTTANLFKRVFLGGYLAYGFSSRRVYGMSKVLYSFIDKHYEESEFPRRSISATYRNDICPLGERNEHTDHDNLFKSYEWKRNSRMMFFDLQDVEIEWDMNNGIGFLAGIKREKDTATPKGGMKFHTMHEIVLDEQSQSSSGQSIFSGNGSICTTELQYEMIYTPPSKRFNARKYIAPINTELPTMGFSHKIGVKMLGGGYAYHLTEIKVLKDWYLGQLGIARTTFKAGCVWNTIPFPVLLAPAANVSYISDDNSFGLLRKSEFLNDRYLQFNASIETNGNLIGLIPIIKRLRWKEFVGVRMLLGALSEKNDPSLTRNWDSRTLMPFPYGCYVMDGNKPYVEVVVGIHNILHVINLDYIFRCTYLDVPESSNGGFRFSLHF